MTRAPSVLSSVLALIMFAANATGAATPVSFIRPGEVLELRMSYGLFGTVGATRIETLLEQGPGTPHYRIRVAARSRGLVDVLYPVRNNSESLIDAVTGRPLSLTSKGRSGNELTDKTTTFDYEKGLAVHVDLVSPQDNATVPLPAEPASDLVATLLQARDWRLKPGESRRLLCVNDDEFLTIEVSALAEEKVQTPAGTFNAVVLEPKQVGKPTGFFKNGGSLKVWISKGEHPQIVRIDTKMVVGTIVALLTKAEIAAPVGLPPAAVPSPASP